MVEVDDEVNEIYLKDMAALNHLDLLPLLMNYLHKYF
jgi:hypothetical protein